MKAIYRQHGRDSQVPVFILEEQAEIPEVGANDVKIQVKACGLSVPSNQVLNEISKKNPSLQYAVGHEIAGVVTEVGSEVTITAVGDRVAGRVPLDSPCSGCSDFCVLSVYDTVKMPDSVSFVDAAAVVGDGVRAFTALHYQAHMCSGDTVLVIDAASSWGNLTLQLAQAWGAKVLATASTDESRNYLEQIQPPVAQIVEFRSKNSILQSSVMEETGGIGVDVIIDNGVRMFNTEQDILLMGENYSHPVPSKHDLISLLGIGGRWVTSQHDLQLDPPDSQQLFLKGVTLAFLFEHVWSLGATQYGRYHHMMRDLLAKVAGGSLKPHITKRVSLDNALDVLAHIQDIRVGKVIVEP